jgi:hypothetical protein
MKRARDSGETLPGCTVRQAAVARNPRDEDMMDEADRLNLTQVGRRGLQVLVGVALALFAVFLYLFNFTAFF